MLDYPHLVIKNQKVYVVERAIARVYCFPVRKCTKLYIQLDEPEYKMRLVRATCRVERQVGGRWQIYIPAECVFETEVEAKNWCERLLLTERIRDFVIARDWIFDSMPIEQLRKFVGSIPTPF